MDSLITAAAQALAAGDPVLALNRVALRDDPPALALRGVAMAQLGDLDRARDLLQAAGRGFGPADTVARARCMVSLAEIALVSRDLGWPIEDLQRARAVLERSGDRANAAHAGRLLARRLLLIGRLDQAASMLAGIDAAALAPAARVGFELALAGVAIRRVRIGPARAALDRAAQMAASLRSAALEAEIEAVASLLAAPAARLLLSGREQPVRLDEVEALLGSPALIVDACRHVVRCKGTIVSLATRPVLSSLAQSLAAGWPGDVTRDLLLLNAFRARHADESHRARLRVEIGRLRTELQGLADVTATARGFALVPLEAQEVVVLAPPSQERHAGLLALLADGESWSSSALALALGSSPRSVQRALEQLARGGRVQPVGHGRARRWMAPPVPGFPTTLLLPSPLPGG
jgi:AraC-like DNA-binding protein